MAFNAAVIVGFCVFIIASSNALPATDKVPSGVIGAFNYVNNTALGTFGGTASPSAAQLPGQVGTGMSSILVTLEPCSILLPHNHPRAAESLFVVEGSFQIGQADEFNSLPGGGSLTTVSAGSGTIFPAGLLHYQQNIGCTRAVFYSAFNSENAGAQFYPDAFFSLPDEAIAAALGLNSTALLKQLKASTSPPAVFGPSSASDCVAKCKAAGAAAPGPATKYTGASGPAAASGKRLS